MTDTPPTYMTDHRGAHVPVSAIKPERIEEHDLVLALVAQAEALSAQLAAFKLRAMGDVQAFRDLIAERYDTVKGGAKGNVTLTSFDGRLQIQVAISESLSFGPELAAAKDLIDACVIRWSEGSNDNIRALVNHAFQTNKQGRIDTGRVLSLRQLEIDDAEWRRAMDAIADAIRVTGSKSYFRVYRRDPLTDHKTPIPLDLASV